MSNSHADRHRVHPPVTESFRDVRIMSLEAMRLTVAAGIPGNLARGCIGVWLRDPFFICSLSIAADTLRYKGVKFERSFFENFICMN